MTDSPPLKKRNLSLSLVATFLIGAGVGASLTYAAIEAMGVDFSRGREQTQAAPASASPADEPVAAVDEAPPPGSPETPPQTPVAELQADVTGLWPARHLFVVLPRAPLSEETLHYLKVFKPGGVVIRPDSMQSAEQVLDLIQAVKTAVGLGVGRNAPPLVIFDPQKTAVQNLGLESLPSPQSIGAMNDEAIALRAGQDVGRALADRGFSMFLGPVLDVYEPGVSEPWLANLAFGARPSLVAAVGVAYAQGVEAGGVLPMVAHYPGLGHARYDDTGLYAIPPTDLRELASLMFPFSKSAAENVPAMLVGLAAVPGLDEDQPARPAALSPVLVRQVIRETWLYEGVLVTDVVSEHAMTRDMPLERAVVQALAAGNDSVMVSDMTLEDFADIAAAMKEALREGGIQQESLNESKRRLDDLQQTLPAPEAIPLPEGEAADAEGISVEMSDAPPPDEPEDQALEEAQRDEAADAPAAETEEPEAADPSNVETETETGNETDSDETENAAEGDAEETDKTTTAETAADTVGYTVKAGDNLRRIAEAHNTSVDSLVELNNLESADMIQLGQRLRVPAPDSAASGN